MARTATPTPVDPYYLRHFHLLADAVLARDAALFTDEERRLLQGVRRLPDSARRLLLRLAGRREGWMRRSHVNYPDIPDLEDALGCLEDSGWLERWRGAPDGAGAICETLTRAEAAHLLRLAGQSENGDAGRLRVRCAGLLKADPEHAIEEQLLIWRDHTTPAARLLELDEWLRLSRHTLFRLLNLLFFGNRHQDLSQFIVTEMGLQRFQQTRPEAAGLFSSREEALVLLAAGERLDRLQEELDELRRRLKGWRKGLRMPPALSRWGRELLRAAWELATPASLMTRSAASPLSGQAQCRRVRLRALLAGAGLLERLGRPGAAAGWQRLALEAGVEGRRRAETWRRLSINLGRSGRVESSSAVCRQALAEDLGPVFRHELSTRLRRAPQLREPVAEGRSAPRHPGHQGGRTLLRNEAGTPLPVEELALEMFRAEGWRGLHAENVLLKALVGLAAWELVFAPAPGAFLHRFQAAPLDWGRPGFLERRADPWRRLRERLRRERHRAGIRERLHSKAGLQNPLVSWSHLQDADNAELWRRGLCVLLEALPGRVLAEAAARLLEHPAECGHGLPDLLLWKEDEAGALREWRLVEVKGPGDRLFLAQRLWLDWLLERGLPAGVLIIGDGNR